MEKRYLELGGKIRKNTSAVKIIVENGVAKGVTLKDGQNLEADWVVSTVPLEHCLNDLLDGKFQDKKFTLRLNDEKTYPIYTYTTAVLKLPDSVKDKSLSIHVPLSTPIVMDMPYDKLSFRNYHYDKTVKTENDKCIVQATIHSNDNMYHWWKEQKENGNYVQTKKRIAEEFLSVAKTVYPDVADQIEVIDVVTPCTYERYLNSRHGSFQGFIHTNKGKALMQNGRLKGLKNFILGGQWIIRSGGLPTAVMSGRFSTQRICHTDKKPFVDPCF
jgi:phytoene dehydrogenase-like protein